MFDGPVTLDEVLGRARELGFLGPGPIEGHVAHSHGFAAAAGAPPPARAADLGSGGGVPGLVLAVIWPDSVLTLIDASQRRTAFLVAAVEALGLGDRVAVVRGRAEEIGRDAAHRGRYDAVVARGFGSPPVTAECAAPLLREGGRLVVSEPPDETDRWDLDGLAQLGLDGGARIGVSVAGGVAHFRTFRAMTTCPDRYPRRTGIPGKRPLW
jgi:16S rRNA (guanine527-N7)-methyltransferase